VKHWNPNRAKVPASRVRRAPVSLESASRLKKVEVRSQEREMWGGVAGTLLFAGILVAVLFGISAYTFTRDDPKAAAEAARFDECYNGTPNCVFDGGTIRMNREKLTIAGMDVPPIRSAQCETERSQGINAAVKLVELLNSGKVSVGPAFQDKDGRMSRRVLVNGRDVAETMIADGVAREYDPKAPGWCTPASSGD